MKINAKKEQRLFDGHCQVEKISMCLHTILKRLMRCCIETLKYLHTETIQENYSMNDKRNAKVIKTIKDI